MSSYHVFGSSASAGQVPDAESTIREQVQDFCTAFNTGNFDHCAELFLSDGQLIIPQHEPAHGPKMIERSLREMADLGYYNLRLETLQVEASGDLAMEVGQFTLGIRSPNGTLTSDRGRYLACWRRFGAWRMTADCWCSVAGRQTQASQLHGAQAPGIISPNAPQPTH